MHHALACFPFPLQRLVDRCERLCTCLLVGCQVLLKLDPQHLVLFAHLGQSVLQLDDLSPQLLLK